MFTIRLYKSQGMREMLTHFTPLPSPSIPPPLGCSPSGAKRLQRDGETWQCFQVSKVWIGYNVYFHRNWTSTSSETQERVLTQRGSPNYNPPGIFCFLQTSGNRGVCVLSPESTTQKTAVLARKCSKSATRILNFTSKEHDWKYWVLLPKFYQIVLFGRRFEDNSLQIHSKLSVFCSHITTVRLWFLHAQTVLGFIWN